MRDYCYYTVITKNNKGGWRNKLNTETQNQQSVNQPDQFAGSKSECASVLVLGDLMKFEAVLLSGESDSDKQPMCLQLTSGSGEQTFSRSHSYECNEEKKNFPCHLP